jgi:hypothetical protein
MKKLVTTLLLGSAAFGVSTAFAQVPVYDNGAGAKKPYVAPPFIKEYRHVAGFSGQGDSKSNAQAPLAGTTKMLEYWKDTTETGISAFGADEERTASDGSIYNDLGFYQRFTSSFDGPNTKIDSIRVSMYVQDMPTVLADGTTNNKGVYFSVFGTRVDELDGVERLFIDFEKTINGAGYFVSPAAAVPMEWHTYTVKFGTSGKYLTTTGTLAGEPMLEFNVLSSRWSTENIIGYAFDRNIIEGGRGELDNEEDRSYYYAVNEDGTFYLTGYMAGRYYTQDDETMLLYPNMIMQAFVRDPDQSSVKKNVPEGMRLAQNYPNMFSDKTRINFATPEYGQATIKVYNNLGTEIATLVDRNMPGGEHTVLFNAENLANGVYTYVMDFNGYRLTKHMTLQR